LPRATPVTEVPREAAAKPVGDIPGRPAGARPRKERRRLRPRKSRPRHVRDAPASRAVIGSGHKHRVREVAKPPSRREPTPESAPPPAPEPVPPVIPEPIPEAAPQPPPAPSSTPGDGSQEFAPH
jgi:hypothetical protein